MAKGKQSGKILNLIVWLTGVIVSLAVGFAMVGGTLTLPWWLGGNTVSMLAGWVVVVTTFVSGVLALLNQ